MPGVRHLYARRNVPHSWRRASYNCGMERRNADAEGYELKRIVTGSWEEARRFDCAQPYAVISFTRRRRRQNPPPLRVSPMRVARLVVAADDVYETTAHSVALTPRQANRIARFVHRVAPTIDTLFIHCRQGLGRSPGAAIAIARAFGLPWRPFVDIPDAAPNGYITLLICRAFEALGYSCGSGDPAEYDGLYMAHLRRASRELETKCMGD